MWDWIEIFSSPSLRTVRQQHQHHHLGAHSVTMLARHIRHGQRIISPALIAVRYASKTSFSRSSDSSSSRKKNVPKKTKDSSIYDFQYTAAHLNLKRFAPEVQEYSDVLNPSVEVADSSKVLRYSESAKKALVHFGGFQKTQRHELFKESATLVRKDLGNKLSSIIKKGINTSSKENRICITGAQGSGRSTALTQLQALAVDSGYVVISIPRALDLVSGSFDTVVDKKNGTKIYLQPMYIRRLMERIAKGNKEILSAIPLSKSYTLGTPGIHSGVNAEIKLAAEERSLYDLVKNKSYSENVYIFESFLEELASQTVAPVLFTLDDLNVFAYKQYARNRDVNNKPIYHGQLQVPNAFLSFLSGEREFKHGAIVGAFGPYRVSETLTVGLGQKDAPSPYASFEEYDATLASRLKGVSTVEVEKFSIDETKLLLDYYKSGNVFPEEVSESFVQERYFLSGNGNAKALVKSVTEVVY